MPNVTPEDLWKRLKNGEFAPVYLLFGAETFRRDAAAKEITEQAMKNAAMRNFNEAAYNVFVENIRDAIATAEQIPFADARRVVRISNINKLNESDEEVLLRYVNNPVTTSVVVLLANDLDKRKKLTKSLLDSAISVEFAALSNEDALRWARKTVRDLKSDADDNALTHLIALVGNDMRLLTNEINKLTTAALPDEKITFELVDTLVPNACELSNFELTDHLIQKNRPRALQILHKILDDGAEPLMLLGLIASNYHRLAWAKETMSRGGDKTEIFRTIKLPPFKHEEFLTTARRSDAQVLSKSLERIADTDLAIKSSIGGGGANGARLQIEMLVCELTM